MHHYKPKESQETLGQYLPLFILTGKLFRINKSFIFCLTNVRFLSSYFYIIVVCFFIRLMRCIWNLIYTIGVQAINFFTKKRFTNKIKLSCRKNEGKNIVETSDTIQRNLKGGNINVSAYNKVLTHVRLECFSVYSFYLFQYMGREKGRKECE